MALTVLILRTSDGEHRIPCPLHSSLTLGCGPECDITLEGVNILPRHCVFYHTGEHTFQIIGVYAAAQFSVNGVISSELEVNVPFKFGIGGEIFDIDLAAEETEPLPVEETPPPAARTEAPSLESRPSRRGYLLKPITLKPRAGERVAEVILPPAPPPAAELPPPPSASPPPQKADASAAAVPQPDQEESSALLLTGLLLCGAMIAAIIYWPHHLDQLESSTPATVAQPMEVAAPALSPQATVRACEDLRRAGAPLLAAQILKPLAQTGDLAAMHQLALALRASGTFDSEAIALLQQAAISGQRATLPDFVSMIDDAENPARSTPAAFKQLQLAASLGEPSAWLPLGERYEHGHGTAPDIQQALAAFEKAQAAGDPRAAAKLSARQAALDRVVAYVRSWNEVSVATLLDHVAAGQGSFFMLDHPSVEALLRLEEELRARWPLRRISVAAGAQAEVETFDLIKVSQPFQFELQRGERIARGTGLLACSVQRAPTGAWRITAASDTITPAELLPSAEQFVTASSLRVLRPAFTHAEQIDAARLEILEQMHGLEATQDFKPALTVLLNAMYEFPQETFWLPFADKLCDRMARQLFRDGKWLDVAWTEPVHQFAGHGSVSAMLLEGHLCAAGYGCPCNPARSVALYQKAFEAGQRRDARFYYAEALFQGRGVPQDIDKASALVLPYMRRSTHPLEAYLAAHLLWRKAEHDPALWQDVYDTLSRVADQFPPAKNLAGMVLLNHGQTTKERKTGLAAIKAAAEEGVLEAMKNLSQCYLDGIGCEKDLHQATFWKQKALVTAPSRRRHYTEFAD